MEGSQRPRRAFGPVPDDWNDLPESTPATPAGPLFDEPELTDTGMMRRLALNPDGSLQNLVPPPRPVLPSSETLPASAGRRFSANDVPYATDWVAPRRSAASVASPPPAYEPLLPPLNRPTAPPPVTVPYQPTTGQTPESRATSPVAVPVPAGSDATAVESAQPSAREAREAAALARADAKASAAAARADERAAKADAKADAKAAKAQAKIDAQAAKAQAKIDAKAAKSGPKDSRAATAELSGDQRGNIAARLGTPEPSTTRAAEAVPPSSRITPTTDEPTKRRSVRPAILVIAAVVVFALLVMVAVWVLALRTSANSGAAGDSAVEALVTASDVTALGTGTWQEAQSSSTPLCVGADTSTNPQRTVSRTLTNGSTDSVLQVASTYADDAAATKAYDEELVLAGTCPAGGALIQGASNVKGLADAAQAVQLLVQGTKNVNHIVLLARTGRTLNVFDIATSANVPVTTAANVAAKPLSRQCTGGTCPSGIEVSASLPAAGSPAGWLVPADLPQLTAGTGKWTAHDWPVNSPGSQCEGIDLTKVSGTTDSGQRTLILTEDDKAPASFGVDQVTYTFADAKSATTLANTLTKNISSCSKRAPTASVDDGPKVKGVGASDASITGSTWEITHKTATTTVIFRVAVTVSGTRVTYVLANPTKSFDFTNDAWQAIALRAAQRASQA